MKGVKERKKDIQAILDEIVQEAKAKKGAYTFDELLKKLPAEYVQSDTLLEQIVIALMEKGVEFDKDLTEHSTRRKKSKRKQDIDSILQAEEDRLASEYKDDPVRIYLKQVAEMRLLSRQEELELAKTIDEARTELTRTLVSTFYGLSRFMYLVQLAQKGLMQAEEIFQVDPGYWTNRVKNQRERKRLSRGIEYLMARWPLARRYFLERDELDEKELREAEIAFKEIVNKILDMGPIFTRIVEIYKDYYKKVQQLGRLYEELERIQNERKMFEEIGAQSFVDEYRALEESIRERIRKMEAELGESYETAKKTAEKLVKIYRKYQWAREKLAEGNVRLVISEAKRYMNRGLDFGDLIQEGNLGLLKAIDKYDWKRGFKFSTYATWWIRQAITRAVADHSRTIRIPIHMIETITKINKAQKALLQEKGREPSIEEIAEYLEMPIEKVERAISVAKEPISMDKPIGKDEDASFGEILSDTRKLPAEEEIKLMTLREKLEEALSMLTPRERKVIELRYGLDGKKPRTLEETGRELGLTRERVRQLEISAIEKLKNPIRIHKLGRFRDMEEL